MEEYMEAYWEWLCSIPGVYRTQIEVLLQFFHSPMGVWQASERELDYLEKKGIRWIPKIKNAQKQMTPENIVYKHREMRIQFISQEHILFPQRLKPLQNHPYGLFYMGQLPAEQQKAIAVVGARMCTRQGKDIAEELGTRIARADGALISGAAYGIDGAAQWAALEAGGKSYALVGGGVDVIYPPSHAALYDRLKYQGGILSEYPPGTRPQRYHFPQRNRIISGIADSIVVVEARKKSGSLLTAEFAAEQGRSVWAVPGRTDDELSQGCNELINQGAHLLLSVDMYIQSVFPDKKTDLKKYSEEIVLAPAEELVYSSLDLHAKSLWEIEECTFLSIAELSESLITLEQKGLIQDAGQNCYKRCL